MEDHHELEREKEFARRREELRELSEDGGLGLTESQIKVLAVYVADRVAVVGWTLWERKSA